jgi:hypothetical protein
VHSGQGECKNNNECTDDKNRGPTPPGIYDMIPSDKYGGSYWLKEGWVTRQLCKLGFGRCEFFLHLGSYSAGCITVERTDTSSPQQFDKLKELLRGDPKNTLEVVP